MEPLTLQEQTAMLFSRWRAIEKLYNQYAKTLGMTYQGLTILDAIYHLQETCTQKSICDQTHLPKQSVNVIIRSLWEQGLVTLHELKSDRRNKEIRLTAAGRAYTEEIIGNIISAEQKIFGQLSYDERLHIIELFQKTEDSLKEMLLTENSSGNHKEAKHVKPIG